MKRITVALMVMLTTVLSSSANPLEEDQNCVLTVGTDTKGSMIQQVEWLYKTEKLEEIMCGIRPATIVQVIQETNSCFKIRCDAAALFGQTKWNSVVLKGNIVIGWLHKDQLRKVTLSDWKKQYGNAQPTNAPYSQPAPQVEKR